VTESIKTRGSNRLTERKPIRIVPKSKRASHATEGMSADIAATSEVVGTSSSLMFPDFVMKEGARKLTFEVGIDYLSDSEVRLRVEEIFFFVNKFVEQTRFRGQASVWDSCQISANLMSGRRDPGRSMFHVVFGLPESFLASLYDHLKYKLGTSNVGIVEYATFIRDEWVPVCHVERGKAWRRDDGDKWVPISVRHKVSSAPIEEVSTAQDGNQDESLEQKARPTGSLLSGAATVVDSIREADMACDVRGLFANGGARLRGAAILGLARSQGYARTGSNIKLRMDRALSSAVRRGILAESGGKLALACRSIGDYSKAALAEQFLASLAADGWTYRDAAILEFARWLGFRRTGSNIHKRSESAISNLVRGGKLERRGPAIRKR